ncbi:MAG: hypothetical protein MMC33_007190 [Icmadophila ericetorum]|nr:hypothetical protein [Icmadophila ericetorum]
MYSHSQYSQDAVDYQPHVYVGVIASALPSGTVSAYSNPQSFGDVSLPDSQLPHQTQSTQEFTESPEDNLHSNPDLFAQPHHSLGNAQTRASKETNSLNMQIHPQSRLGHSDDEVSLRYQQSGYHSEFLQENPFSPRPRENMKDDSYVHYQSNLGDPRFQTMFENSKEDVPAYSCQFFEEPNAQFTHRSFASHRHSTACIPPPPTSLQYQVQPKARFSVPTTPTNGLNSAQSPTKKSSIARSRTMSMAPVQTSVVWSPLERSFGALGMPITPERQSFQSFQSPQYAPGSALQDPDPSQAARVLASMASSNTPYKFPAHLGYATSDGMIPTMIRSISKVFQTTNVSPYDQGSSMYPKEPEPWDCASPEDDCQSDSGSSTCTEICDRPDCEDEGREDCELDPCTPGCHVIPCTDPKSCNPKSLCTTPCPVSVPVPAYNTDMVLMGMESMDMTFAQCEWALQNGHGQCNASLPSRGALGEHVLKNHIQPQLAQICPFECGATVVPDSLAEHVIGEHQKSTFSQFVCLARGCDFIGQNEADLDEHLKSAHLSKGVECHWGDCSVTAKNPDALNGHVRTEHLSMKTPITTPSESLDSPSESLDSPVHLTPPGDDRKVCLWVAHDSDTPCHVVFDTGNELQAHIEKAHIKPLKGVLSKHCRWAGCERETRAFTQKEKLRIHMYTHTGFRGARCEICGKECVNKDTLAAHMRTHTNVKPFKCNQCSSVFSHESSLNTHIKNIHEGLKTHRCHCGYSTADNSNFAKHKKTHLPPGYPCEECEKKFSKSSNLTRHMRTHQKARELEAQGLTTPSPKPRKAKSSLSASGADHLKSPSTPPTASAPPRKRSHSDMSSS